MSQPLPTVGPIHISYSTSLPFLVYGTLRPGEGNHGLVSTRTRVLGEVRIPGFYMVDSGAYPYALDGTQRDSIVCTVLEAHTDRFASVVRDLDALEGFYGVQCENH